MAYVRKRKAREAAIMMTSSAGLELFWSAAAFGAALLGITGTAPLALSAITAICLAFALFARSGAMAVKWPSTDGGPGLESDAISVNFIGGLAALGMGAFALAGLFDDLLAPLALLLLAGLLVLDAPLEPALAAPRGYAAGVCMVLAGLSAIIVLTAGFAMRAHGYGLVPWAALTIASAHVVAAAAVVLRFARRTFVD